MIFSGGPKISYLAIRWSLGDRIMIIVGVIIIIIIYICVVAGSIPDGVIGIFH